MSTHANALIDEEAGTMPPVQGQSPLQRHFVDERRAFDFAGGDARGNRNREQELLALGGIRRLYWLALGAGETHTATEIALWWQQCQPLHQLDELIR